MDFYLQAYHDLQYDRPLGMALGPIPWTSIINYAHLNGMSDPDDIAELVTIIRALECASEEFDQRKESK